MLNVPSLVLVLGAIPTSVSAQDVLGVNWQGFAYSLDSTDWGMQLVGWSGLSLPRSLNGLTVSGAGTVYAVGDHPELYTLDPATGEAIRVDPLPTFDFRAVAWDSTNGTLLAIRHAGDSPEDGDELWRIDPGTLAATLVATLSLHGFQAMEFAPDGTLYAYNNGVNPGDMPGAGLVVLDPATGAVSDPFPSVSARFNTQWLAFDAAGQAYAGNEDIRRVDLTTGTETQVGTAVREGLRGVVFVPVQVQHRALCFGDGSAGTCPCANFGSALFGCSNATGLGSSLAATGSRSASNDDLHLAAIYVPWNQPGLFFQGSEVLAAGDGIAFGDGLRCVGTDVIRLESVMARGLGMVTTQVPIAATGGVSAGDTRYYQLWYRNPGTSLCGSGFNLSNAVQVDWTP